MLSIGARLPKHYRSCGIFDVAAGSRDTLAIALHGELLKVGGKTMQILVKWRDQVSLRTEEVAIPNTQEASNDRNILLKWRLSEMSVHCMGAGKELVEVVVAYVNGHRQSNCTPY